MKNFDDFKVIALDRLAKDSKKTHDEYLSLLNQSGYNDAPDDLRQSIMNSATMKLATTHTLTILEEYHAWLMKVLLK